MPPKKRRRRRGVNSAMEDSARETREWEYAGFWIRLGASIADSVLIFLITAPLLWAVYGPEYFAAGEDAPLFFGPAEILIEWVIPAVAVIAFWNYKNATPGKMLIGTKIVDAKTGKPPTPAQCAGRYAAYFLSAIPLGLGFVWVAFDERKQGWHDKLANTVVVKLFDPDATIEFHSSEEKKQ